MVKTDVILGSAFSILRRSDDRRRDPFQVVVFIRCVRCYGLFRLSYFKTIFKQHFLIVGGECAVVVVVVVGLTTDATP